MGFCALLLAAPCFAVPDPGVSASVVGISAVRESADGVRLDWLVDGGIESDPLWVVEARPAGGDSTRVWKAIGAETTLGREPDGARYTARLPVDAWVDSLEIRVWAEGLQDKPGQGLVVPTTTPAIPAKAPRPASFPLKTATASVPAERVRLVVAETARYVVTAAQLAAPLASGDEALVRAWIAATNLAVTCQGQPVAWHPVDGGDGIAFIGRAYRDLYTDRNVYWIAPGPGLAMAEAPVAPISGAPSRGAFWQELRIEPDREPWETLPAERPLDCWYWDWVDTLTQTNKQSALLPFATPDAVPGADPATLRLWCRPFLSNSTYPEPHARFTLSLDGTVLATPVAGGADPAVFTCSAPAALLADSNALQVAIARTNGALRVRYAIDSITVRYRRAMTARAGTLDIVLDAPGGPVVAAGFPSAAIDAYAIAGTGQPVLLAGASVTTAPDGSWQSAFTAPANVSNLWLTCEFRSPDLLEGVGADPWAGTDHEVDYLVVAPEAFLPALQPLLQARSSQGLRTGVLKAEDLYRLEMGGRFSPFALRAFLVRSRAWRGPPSKVLLVGSGHYDYLGIFGSPSWQPNPIPPAVLQIPYEKSASGWLIVGTDNALADLDGDGAPDVAIGRLPARSAAETERMVAKALADDASRATRTAAAAVSDLNLDTWQFSANAAAWLARLPAGLSRQAISEHDAPAGANARQYIGDTWRTALDDGRWLSAYFGHANAWFLGEMPYYLAFDAVASLDNRPGVLVGTTCAMNDLFKPQAAPTWAGCVGAELLRGTDGGMVAVFAPVSPSFEAPGSLLADAIADAVSTRRPCLGDAVLEALRALQEDGGTPWILQTMLLLGDPALDLRPAEVVFPGDATLLLLH